MYTLQYSLSEEDYLQYNIVHQFSTPMLRKRMKTVRFVFTAFYAAIATFFLFIVPRTVFSVVFGVLCACAACFYFFCTAWRVKRSLRRSIGKMKTIGKLPSPSDVHVTFDEEAIHAVTEASEERTKYAAIERIIVGGDAFYIYRAAIAAFIVPFRAFHTAQARQDFLAFIEAKAQVEAIQGRTD